MPFTPKKPFYALNYLDNYSKRKQQAIANNEKAMSGQPMTNQAFDFSELVRTSLNEAFDEGCESPFDLKESIIEGILSNISKQLRSQATPKNLPQMEWTSEKVVSLLEDRTPVYVKKCLKATTRSFFCGGQLIKRLRKPVTYAGETRWKSDYDIFVHKDDLHILPVMEEHKLKDITDTDAYSEMPSLSRVEQVFVGNVEGLGKFNVITGDFNKLEDVIEGFDFVFLQAGCFYDGEGKFRFALYDEQVWSDLLWSVIRLNPLLVHKYPSLSTRLKRRVVERIEKYMMRGFHDTTGLAEQGVLSKIVCELSKV